MSRTFVWNYYGLTRQSHVYRSTTPLGKSYRWFLQEVESTGGSVSVDPGSDEIGKEDEGSSLRRGRLGQKSDWV